MLLLKGLLGTLLAVTSCSNVDTTDPTNRHFGEVQPNEGTYQAIGSGLLYEVSTSGPAAIGVTRTEDEFCLMFWEGDSPDVPSEIAQMAEGMTFLYGQECSNGEFGDLDWRMIYDPRRPEVFIIYPPRHENGQLQRPIEIRYLRDSDPNDR